MNKFKINSNKTVVDTNKSLIFPNISTTDYIKRSVSFTPETKNKLDILRAKYKISRSAIIRILLDEVVV